MMKGIGNAERASLEAVGSVGFKLGQCGNALGGQACEVTGRSGPLLSAGERRQKNDWRA